MRLRGLGTVGVALLMLMVGTSGLLAWGQPEHAVLGETVLRNGAANLPPELSAPGSRDAFVYGCYSPDGYLFHGPKYVHLDRHFAVFMLKHARDARGVALAYGWASHMEQDVAGHGRYIKESGLNHLKKELACGTRVRYQGAGWEKKVIKGMKAIFDAKQVHQASAEYAATYGSQYKVITEKYAKTTGLGYAAYLTAIKGVMFANYYGNLKWRKKKYPRSEFQFALDESVGLTDSWCQDFGAFSRSTAENLKMALFGRLQDFLTEEAAPAPALSTLDVVAPEKAAHEVRASVRELLEARRRDRTMPLFAPSGFSEEAGDMPESHVLVQDPGFMELGASLANSSGIEMVEYTDGTFHSVEPVVVDQEVLVKDMLDVLEANGGIGFFAEGGLPGERGEFFSELRDMTRKAVDQIDSEER